MDRRGQNNLSISEMRRVLYTGDHPHIKDKTGVTYFHEGQECDLFRPDIDHDGLSNWYRVRLENLVRLD